jgi:hypothetical protein
MLISYEIHVILTKITQILIKKIKAHVPLKKLTFLASYNLRPFIVTF